MDYMLIETGACNELRALVDRLLERIAAYHARCMPSASAWRMTSDEVCKALSLSKRALQHYRTTGVIPYSSLGNRIVFRETDIARILQANFIPAEKR